MNYKYRIHNLDGSSFETTTLIEARGVCKSGGKIVRCNPVKSELDKWLILQEGVYTFTDVKGKQVKAYGKVYPEALNEAGLKLEGKLTGANLPLKIEFPNGVVLWLGKDRKFHKLKPESVEEVGRGRGDRQLSLFEGRGTRTRNPCAGCSEKNCAGCSCCGMGSRKVNRVSNPRSFRYPKYPFYVVLGDNIVGGWDYREDAKEHIETLKEEMGIIGTKILTARTVKTRGLKWESVWDSKRWEVAEWAKKYVITRQNPEYSIIDDLEAFGTDPDWDLISFSGDEGIEDEEQEDEEEENPFDLTSMSMHETMNIAGHRVRRLDKERWAVDGMRQDLKSAKEILGR